MGNYYNPVKIKIDSIDVIEDVLNKINPQLKNIVLLHREVIFQNHRLDSTSTNVLKILKSNN